MSTLGNSEREIPNDTHIKTKTHKRRRENQRNTPRSPQRKREGGLSAFSAVCVCCVFGCVLCCVPAFFFFCGPDTCPVHVSREKGKGVSVDTFQPKRRRRRRLQNGPGRAGLAPPARGAHPPTSTRPVPPLTPFPPPPLTLTRTQSRPPHPPLHSLKNMRRPTSPSSRVPRAVAAVLAALCALSTSPLPPDARPETVRGAKLGTSAFPTNSAGMVLGRVPVQPLQLYLYRGGYGVTDYSKFDHIGGETFYLHFSFWSLIWRFIIR